MQQQRASRLFGAIQICFEEIDKNEFGQMFSHSRIVKKWKYEILQMVSFPHSLE